MFQSPIPTLTTLQKSSLAYIKIFQNGGYFITDRIVRKPIVETKSYWCKNC